MSDSVVKRQLIPLVDIISFKLTNIKGKQIDLTKIFLSITIYESLFNHFLHGNFILLDTFDLQKNFPIIGNEDVEIQIKTEDQDIIHTMNFKVYKLRNDQETTTKTVQNKKVLIIDFCSPEQLLDADIKISKKLNGTSENIIKQLISTNLNSKKNFEYEKSEKELSIFSNYWEPTKIIDFCSRLSKTKDFSDFIFFENLKGFNFKTISSLIGKESKQKFSFKEGLLSLAETTNMRAFKTENHFNLLNHFNLFGSTIFKPHETDYSYTKTEITLTDIYKQIGRIGSNEFFDNKLDNKLDQVVVNHYEPDISKIRPISIHLLDNYKIVAKLNGSLERTIGDIITVQYKAHDGGNVDIDNFDDKYLIGKIKHQIWNNGKYYQNLLLLKNSFASNKVTDKIGK